MLEVTIVALTQPTEAHMKFIHITDTHLVPRGEQLHGLNPCDRLDACVDDINKHHLDAEFCVITGDLADKGQAKTYRDLKDCLDRLRLPVHLLVGNHDDRTDFLQVFPDVPVDENGFVQTVLDTAAGAFILLDTVERGKGWGSFCDKRAAWLERQLKATDGQTVYLFMHHPPFEVGLPSLDRLGLGADGQRMAEVLAPHDTIRHLFFGHVHRPITGSWRGIPFSTMYGTNHQVLFDLQEPEVIVKTHEPPAYAVVFLTPDQTTVHFHDYLDRTAQPRRPASEGRPDWRPSAS